MKRIEALADAFSEYNGYSDPTGVLYKLRNPGGLKAFSIKQPQDSNTGYRLFDSLVDGYKALLFDLSIKCSGQSNSGLTTNSTLTNLVRVMGMQDESTRYIVKFLRKALSMPELKDDTKISFFLE